jgi:L-ascorbate metabolism protein UlaG (beta-lactamase superfamily)
MGALTFHGHACFEIAANGHRLVIDPFLNGNPAADIGPDELPPVTAVLLSHGHGDHLGDTVAIAKRDKATVIATFELATFLAHKGCDTHPMHIGGAHTFPFGRVKLVPAIHGGAVEGDETGQFTTFPCGLVVTIGGTRIYHVGDSALTMDMKLLEGMVDIMLVPIGDNFTMGVDDAVRAVSFVKPKTVIPMHFGTWDLIGTDPNEFATKVGSTAQVVILRPGESHQC